jgi:hypothetical protein
VLFTVEGALELKAEDLFLGLVPLARFLSFYFLVCVQTTLIDLKVICSVCVCVCVCTPFSLTLRLFVKTLRGNVGKEFL